MLEFITFLVKELVNNPDDVIIEQKEEAEYTNYLINVYLDDMALIIGKGGKTIKGVRNLAKAKAIKDQVRINIELVEHNTPNDQI